MPEVVGGEYGARAFLDAIRAVELAWWDGFHRGCFAASLGAVVLIGVVVAIRRKAN